MPWQTRRPKIGGPIFEDRSNIWFVRVQYMIFAENREDLFDNMFRFERTLERKLKRSPDGSSVGVEALDRELEYEFHSEKVAREFARNFKTTFKALKTPNKLITIEIRQI